MSIPWNPVGHVSTKLRPFFTFAENRSSAVMCVGSASSASSQLDRKDVLATAIISCPAGISLTRDHIAEDGHHLWDL